MRSSILLFSMLALAASPAVAQSLPESLPLATGRVQAPSALPGSADVVADAAAQDAHARLAAADAHARLAPAALPMPVAPVLARRASMRSRVTRFVTGAAIGGWLGYFASQVAVSDWDDGSSLTARGGWAAAGMLAGAVTGLMTVRGPGAVQGPLRPDIATSGRGPIEQDEIRRSGAVNAFELVRSLRKEWLIPRGVNSFRESARGHASLEEGLSITPGADHILVYLNSARLGGTQHLEEISLAMVERIEFVEPAQAVFRWGTGHAHGVILLTSAPPQSER